MKQGGNNARPIWHDELRCYVCSKLFWDLTLSVEDLVREYCNIYFGIAGETIANLTFDMEKFFEKKINTEGFHIDLGGGYKEFFDYKQYPLKILQEWENTVLKTIEKVNTCDEYSAEEKRIYDYRLSTVLLTPVRMIVRNKDDYFKDDEKTALKYENRFIELANKVSMKKLGEVVPLYIDFVSNNTSKYKIVTGQNPTADDMESAKYIQNYVKEKTGFVIPLAKDNEVYPAYWERAIMLGENTMTKEFYKSGLDISKLEYFVDVKGWVVFINSPVSVLKAAEVFVRELVKNGDSENSLEIVAKKRVCERSEL